MKMIKAAIGFIICLMVVSGILLIYLISGKSVSAADKRMINDMGVGWNLGNTFDSARASHATESYWGQPYTTHEMIDELADKGFRTIRIPVTWTYKTSGYPDYTINTAWLDRVEQVVGYAMDNNMYVIINAHHENDNIIPTYAKQDECTYLIDKLWTQIAYRFKDYSDKLIFEVLNEPRQQGIEEEWSGGTAENRQVLNKYNMTALNAIRKTGGNNADRMVMIPTIAASISSNTINDLEIPKNDENIIVSVHAYSPYYFAMKGDGTDKWGSDSDKAEIDSLMKMLYDKFVSKGTPVIIGEFGATNKNNLGSRIIHAGYFVSAARKCGITCIWWDNGVTTPGEEAFGIFDRNNLTWYFPEIAEAMIENEELYAERIEYDPEPAETPVPTLTPEPTDIPEPKVTSEPVVEPEKVSEANGHPMDTVNLNADGSENSIDKKTNNNKVVKIVLNKKTIKLKIKKTFRIKIKKIVYTDRSSSLNNQKITYKTSKKKIASVSKKGVIKAKKTGKCIIYAYAENGIFAKIKVTVKK